MSADCTAALEVTLDQLRQRWGAQIITRACERVSAPTISSGFPKLDELLNGGFPVGQISLLAGIGTCGAGTLACQVVAHAQRARRPVIWLDGQGTFDAAYAVYLGVSLDDLVLIQPVDQAHALALARDLADLLPGGLTVFTWPSAFVQGSPTNGPRTAPDGRTPGSCEWHAAHLWRETKGVERSRRAGLAAGPGPLAGTVRESCVAMKPP